MISHSTGPFDPVAEAHEPDDPGPFTGPPSGPFRRAPVPPSAGVRTGSAGEARRGAFTGRPARPFTIPPSGPPAAPRPPSGPFTGHPSGPFAAPPTGPPSGPFTGHPSGPFAAPPTGPPSGPFPTDHRVQMGPGPPDHHHEAAHPEAVYAGAQRPDRAYHDPGYRSAPPLTHPDLIGVQADDDEQVWAMMAYLGVIFFAFLPPLAVYVVKRRESRYVRVHAAQALNLWITAFLYSVSFVIIGGILALDSISTAVSVGLPLIAATGAAMLLLAVRAALAAGRGALYQIPSSICVPMVT